MTNLDRNLERHGMLFVEAPQVRIGDPKNGIVFMRGVVAAFVVMGPPSKAIDSRITVERRRLRVHVRLWHCGTGPRLWMSAGYYDLSAFRHAWLLLRSLFRARQPRIPVARTIRDPNRRQWHDEDGGGA